MNTPIPVNPPQVGWKPTTSTVAGAALGTAVAQLIIAGLESMIHHSVASATGGAITTVCIFAIGYLFPDGGRK